MFYYIFLEFYSFQAKNLFLKNKYREFYHKFFESSAFKNTF